MRDADVNHMNQLIEQNRFGGSLDGSVPSAFGYDVDMDGCAKVGRGTDGEPTLVGITTRALLGRLRYARDKVLHIDATFKLNQSGYPVIVFGVSDQGRSFHPVALFVTSQLQATHYKRALERLFQQYEECFVDAPVVSDIMTDADDALYNALGLVFEARGDMRPQHLMCFFHVMMNVKKHSSR
jgi:hypothetical protein